MTQLDLAGGFRHAAALVVGICENCGPEHEDISLTLERTLGLLVRRVLLGLGGMTAAVVSTLLFMAGGSQATLVEQQVVSACLAAHTNKFGVHVTLAMMGTNAQGVAEVIIYNQKEDLLEGGVDRRAPDGGAGLVSKK